jgi:hypothetical protein
MTDEQLNEFIDDAGLKQHGDDWWNMGFFEEAEEIAKELKGYREERNARTDR